METIYIKYPKKRKSCIYELEISKLLFLFSNFENKKIEFQSFNQIKKLMKKYKLYDKMFLENFSKL